MIAQRKSDTNGSICRNATAALEAASATAIDRTATT
jgi:hypothetical protein